MKSARGEPLTTASDIYALGLILYELLTGTRPYEIVTKSYREIEHKVCQSEPPRPSDAVARAIDADPAAGAPRRGGPGAPPPGAMTIAAICDTRATAPAPARRATPAAPNSAPSAFCPTAIRGGPRCRRDWISTAPRPPRSPPRIPADACAAHRPAMEFDEKIG